MDEHTRDDDERRLLTVPEVATKLGQHRSTIYRKASSGSLPTLQLGPPGAALRIDPDELEA